MKRHWTSPNRSDPTPTWHRLLGLLLVFAQLAGGAWSLLPGPAQAAVRTGPAWWDGNSSTVTSAAQSAWHYRVPITVPSGTPANATVKLDVDFAALLATMGIGTATLDINSPRVVDSSGTLAPAQEFNNGIYAGATDSNPNRGEVRFLLPSTSGSYFLYFDIAANGTKAALASSYYIGGNFENSATGTLQPPGWTVTRANTVFDAQVRPSESVSVTSDGTMTAGQSATRTVAGTPYTGQYSYLLGARTNNEPASSGQSVTMSRTIVVPATNPGSLTFRYRTQGWDSNTDGNTTQYDYLSAALLTGGVSGTVVRNMVGPATTPNAVTYVTFPFSPNKGTAQVTTTVSGYGQYNGFTMGTNGTSTTVGGQTVARGAEPWFTVTQDLSAWAGQTITLRFSTSYTNLYRSWWHIDDVEWSVVSGSLGTAQAFGAAIQLPAGAATTIYYPDPVAANRRLVIRAQLDAVGTTGSVAADVLDPTGTTVATVTLYNDGTHGDTTSGDAIWTNDSALTGYSFPASPTAAQLGTYTILLHAKDGAGVDIHIPSQPASPVNGTNFYNVDTQTLSFQNFNTLTGRVYVDVNRNGLYATGDSAWSTSSPGAPIYVKLVQAGAVVAVATPDPSTGIYIFGNLKIGTYTVVPSTNNLTTDPNASLPAGWTQSQPKTATFTTDLANGQTVNDDIGLYRSDMVVSGRVLSDNGAGGATALDGVQGGGELGLAAVVVQAATTSGTVLAQSSTAGDGTFSLGLPATSAGTPVVVSIQAPSTASMARVFAGSTGGTLNQASGTITFTPAASTSYSGVVFSTIPAATLAASQAKTAQAGTAVFYAHRLIAGSTGSMAITLSSSPSAGAPAGWTGVLYQDAACAGALTGSEAPLVSPLAVTAGQQICLVVRDSVPAAASLNERVTHTLTATLSIASASYTQASVSNADVTTVGTPQNSGLTLVKAVKNITTSGSFGTSSQALPGQSLQYQLTFRNDHEAAVSNVQIYDSVPAYSVFAGAACGTMPAGVTCAVAVQPASGATVGSIQWNLTGSVPPGAGGTVTFDWSVAP